VQYELDCGKSNTRSMSEKVNHPAHYGGDTPYEVIKVLRHWFSDEQFEGFLVGNAIKYLSRYKKKNGLEDVKKAQWYVNYLVELLEKQK
jgi:Protein of unknwon function (DUF3310)